MFYFEFSKVFDLLLHTLLPAQTDMTAHRGPDEDGGNSRVAMHRPKTGHREEKME